MSGKKVEEKVRQAFTRATPDVLDEVLAQWDRQNAGVIPMPRAGKKRRWPSVAAAALALCVGLGLYQSGREVVSTVSLDVNPGIEIEANRWGRVLAVSACNEDALGIIKDENFEGLRLEQAVSWLIDTLIARGYLREGSDAVLISILDENKVRGQALENDLAQSVTDQLQAGNIEGTVLSQTVEKNDEVSRIAGEYGVTRGKAFLMKLIVETHGEYTCEELSTWSVRKLWTLFRGETAQEQMETTYYVRPRMDGKAVKTLVLEQAGVSPEKAQDWEYRLEYWLENGEKYGLAPAYAEGLYQFSTTSSDHGSLYHIVSFTVEGQRRQYQVKDFTGAVTENDETEELK